MTCIETAGFPGARPLQHHTGGYLCWHDSPARVSELTPLRVTDIKEEDGIFYFDVVEDEEQGKRLKTKAARRKVPVHPTLLELGLMGYVSELEAQGFDRLLPGFKIGERIPGEYASKWWRETFRNKLLPDSVRRPKITFHSFRHTFITQAHDVAGIPLPYVQDIVGHEKRQMGATATYSHGRPISVLVKDIEQVKFEGLDLSHLVGGWKKHPLNK